MQTSKHHCGECATDCPGYCHGGLCQDGYIPSNAADFGGFQRTGLMLGPVTGGSNTSTDCAAGSVLGDCTVVTRSDAPEVCVCHADTLYIAALTVGGTRALALLVSDTVTVSGTLSVAGRAQTDGPGAAKSYSSSAGGSVGGGGSFASIGGDGGNDYSVEASWGNRCWSLSWGACAARAGARPTVAGEVAPSRSAPVRSSR